jgi:polysaccharide chain length determinant protein (PEP-CTERM system associated)
MNPLLNQVLDEVASAWRYRWYALGTAVAIALGGWLVIFALQDRYEAEASVFVDSRNTSLKPALQGLVVEQDIDTQLNFVRQSLLAGPQLERIAREGGVLPATGVDARRQGQLIAAMSARIGIVVRSASGHEEDRNTAGSIYRVFYQDEDRARSVRVVGILLDTLVNETLGGKREGAQNAQQFLETQVRDYESRLRAAEDRLAAFKSRHIGLMPTEQGGYFAQLQAESTAVANTRTKLAEAQSRRATLVKQLHGDVAIAAAAAAPSGSRSGAGGSLDTLTRIDEAQAKLDDLLLRFTENHPDVIAARQTLEDLKKRRAAEIEGLRQGDAAAAASSRASSNPVYQSIQLALNQVDVEMADLNTELAQHESKVVELRRMLDTAPQIEAEFAQLNRDYDVNKAQYTALLASLQKAKLGERADDAGSIRFEVVEPPTAGLRPVWPHRKTLMAMILAAAMGAGAALAYGLSYLHAVVPASAEGLSQLAGVSILGVVSGAFPQRMRRTLRREAVKVALAACCLMAAFGIALVLSQKGYRLSAPTLTRTVSQ